MELVDFNQAFNNHIRLMMKEMPSLSTSPNLIKSALFELDFLKTIDDNAHLYYEPDFVRRSVYRYENYWLPFLAKVSSGPATDSDFVPPLDIHWVWHVHMLAPVAYSQDCHQIVNRLLDHKLYDPAKTADLRRKTEVMWANTYPDVPFDITPESPSEKEVSEFSSKIKYNIEAAAQRQGAFYYQVSLDHYRDPNFLYDALRRYQMYLFLKRKNPKTFLVCRDSYYVHMLIGDSLIKLDSGSLLRHGLDLAHASSASSHLSKGYLCHPGLCLEARRLGQRPKRGLPAQQCGRNHPPVVDRDVWRALPKAGLHVQGQSTPRAVASNQPHVSEEPLGPQRNGRGTKCGQVGLFCPGPRDAREEGHTDCAAGDGQERGPVEEEVRGAVLVRVSAERRCQWLDYRESRGPSPLCSLAHQLSQAQPQADLGQVLQEGPEQPLWQRMRSSS